MARLLVLCCAVVACSALRVQPTTLRGPSLRRVHPRCSEADADGAESEPPALASAPDLSGQGVMPDKFLGVFDMKSTAGSLGASLVVAVIFCTVVEGIKAFDPRPEVVSMFGKF